MDDFLRDLELELKPMHPRAFRLSLERMLEDARVPIHFSADLKKMLQALLPAEMGITLPETTLALLLAEKDNPEAFNALVFAILEDIQSQMAIIDPE